MSNLEEYTFKYGDNQTTKHNKYNICKTGSKAAIYNTINQEEEMTIVDRLNDCL